MSKDRLATDEELRALAGQPYIQRVRRYNDGIKRPWWDVPCAYCNAAVNEPCCAVNGQIYSHSLSHGIRTANWNRAMQARDTAKPGHEDKLTPQEWLDLATQLGL